MLDPKLQERHAAQALADLHWTVERIALALKRPERTVRHWLQTNRVAGDQAKRSCRSFADQARLLGD